MCAKNPISVLNTHLEYMYSLNLLQGRPKPEQKDKRTQIGLRGRIDKMEWLTEWKEWRWRQRCLVGMSKLNTWLVRLSGSLPWLPSRPAHSLACLSIIPSCVSILYHCFYIIISSMSLSSPFQSLKRTSLTEFRPHPSLEMISSQDLDLYLHRPLLHTDSILRF